MLENFQAYFDAIQLPGPMIDRAEQICAAFDEAIEKPVHDIFVSDFFEQEGARRYTSLFLRTPWHLIEVKNFVVQQQMDFTRLADAEYLEFTRSDLVNWDQTEPKSTLVVQVRYRFQLQAFLTAAHNNCRYLFLFASKHLMPKGIAPPDM